MISVIVSYGTFTGTATLNGPKFICVRKCVCACVCVYASVYVSVRITLCV